MADDTLKIQAEPSKLLILRGKTSLEVRPDEIDDLIGKLRDAAAIVKLPAPPATWEISKVPRSSVTDPVKP